MVLKKVAKIKGPELYWVGMTNPDLKDYANE
jgi:hypothetical protein